MPPDNSRLAQTLADVRKRIAKRSKLNENDTKATLVEPVLSALGWDVGDVDEVAREHKAPKGKPVDYALLVMREPKLYVEAKGLGEDLEATRCANQIMGYASVAGVEWIVITDGDEWRIYNSHATVPIAEKLLRSVRISDPNGGAEEILALLSKDQLKTKLIDAMWRAQFVDRRVQAALEHLFDADHDMALVNHVRAAAKDLTPEEIRGSLRRCKHSFDFPLSPADLRSRGGGRRGTDGITPPRATSDVTLSQLIQAGLLTPPVRLTKRYKGKDLEARILKDGTVECVGKSFTSLSIAGSAARATVTGLQADGSMRATNGWTFWRCRRPDGRVVEVDQVRQQFQKDQGSSATG